MKFKRGYCQFCKKLMIAKVIPNRGVVMAHQKGDGGRCQRLRKVSLDNAKEKS